MNENPYASPTKITEETGEMEKYRRSLWRLSWGVFWHFISSVSLTISLLFVLSKISGLHFLPALFNSPTWPVFEFFAMLIIVTLTGFPGIIYCCFCPDQLVKRGGLYVAGSVGILVAAVYVPIHAILTLDYLGPVMSFVLLNFFMVGTALSILTWLFFLLRLARAIARGKRSAWVAISVYCVIAAWIVVYINIDLLIVGSEYSGPWWWHLQDVMQTLATLVAIGFGCVYAVLLWTLWRRIGEMVGQSLRD